MIDDRRDINTDGGDYEEVNNYGQYAKGDIYNNYQQTPAKLRDTSEAKLLAAVKNEVAGRLAQSLHNRVYIELNKEEDPSQVIQPWAVDVKLGNQPSQRCPEGTNIVDIFDKPEIGGKLLILGAPGSGKTMMLLQLAEELVQRADKNAAHPVPVLLNLSAWKAEFKDIPSWMVADLKLKYGVRQDIAKKWIEEGRILPLLDGLDELMSERQETCVRALNEFLPAWSGVPLVVCSRREEYQNYEANLGLHGAVILQPLTDGQIEKFLRGAGCDWLWEAVRQDSDVMGEEGLSRSPLLLTILALASGGLPGELWQKEEGTEERRRILFEAYIAERLRRRYVGGKNLPATKHGQKPYKDDEKTKAWLSWLALWLIEENQTEFFIEKLQPRFLATRRQKFDYGMTIGLIFWLLTELFMMLWMGINTQVHDTTLLDEIGLYNLDQLFSHLICLANGMLYGLSARNSSIKTVEAIKIHWTYTTNFFKMMFYRLFVIIPILLFIGILINRIKRILVDGESLEILYISSLFQYFSGNGFMPSLTLWLACALCMLMLEILSKNVLITDVDNKSKENQGIYQSILNSMIFGLLVALTFIFAIIPTAITTIIITKPNKSLTFAIFIAFGGSIFLLTALLSGLSSAISHYSLRLTLWLFGYSPLNYSKFLRYCTERGFLQRVGGGYRFVHALLRDHFAAQYTSK